MRRRLAACAMSLVFASVGPALAADDPASLMTAIYRKAVIGAGPDWLSPEERPRHLSKSLVILWAKADAKKVPDGEVGAIDFDITADTNALELASFKVATPSSARVDIELEYKKPYVKTGRLIVSYDFVKEAGGWKIDNIHTTRWSVRALLKAWLAQR